MANINKVRVIKSRETNTLEDKVNKFLEESMDSIPGFCVMNLCYQTNVLPNPQVVCTSSMYMVELHTVVIHYVYSDYKG
jgi:hypothetical protein